MRKGNFTRYEKVASLFLSVKYGLGVKKLDTEFEYISRVYDEVYRHKVDFIDVLEEPPGRNYPLIYFIDQSGFRKSLLSEVGVYYLNGKEYKTTTGFLKAFIKCEG